MYYVKAMTRSSGGSRQGTPRRAIGYITDNHDAHRNPGCSKAELRYIARLGEGWKTELEGGRVPLVGFGILHGVDDVEELTARFEGGCQPWHDRRGSTGYKSFTFTLPKEVSLFAEGHREQAKAAMYAGVREALGRAFAGLEIAAVAAIHTRNEAGEIHFHAHVLVAKFARNRATGRMVSLNSKAGGNSASRVRDLKAGWKEAVDRELAVRLNLRVDQGRSFARPALVLPEGTRLPPLDRESRRLLDQRLAPTYDEVGSDRGVVKKVLRLNDAMDGRIFEVCSGRGGEGWSAAGFLAVAPDQGRWLGRYEKRVETLRKAGYLTTDGKVTPAFRLHYSVRQGVDTPELQRVRLDLAREASRESARRGAPAAVRALPEAAAHDPRIEARVRRLGLTAAELRRIHDEAERRKPTPATLRLIRKTFERQALARPPQTVVLPRVKSVPAAFVGYQQARLRAAGTIVAGILRLQYTKHRKIAAAIRAGASRDLFYAKERRLAEIGLRLRPAFWATRLILPRQTRRLELAIARCVALTKTRQYSREWRRRFVAERKANLLAERTRSQAALPIPARVPAPTPVVAPSAGRADSGVELLRLGLEVMRQYQPQEAALLDPWQDRLPELNARVAAVARGEGPVARPRARGGHARGPRGPPLEAGERGAARRGPGTARPPREGDPARAGALLRSQAGSPVLPRDAAGASLQAGGIGARGCAQGRAGGRRSCMGPQATRDGQSGEEHRACAEASIGERRWTRLGRTPRGLLPDEWYIPLIYLHGTEASQGVLVGSKSGCPAAQGVPIPHRHGHRAAGGRRLDPGTSRRVAPGLRRVLRRHRPRVLRAVATG